MHYFRCSVTLSCGHIGTCYKGLGHVHHDGANSQIQTHFVSKIMHENLATILQQLYYEN